jgi:hypothetical protein
VAENKATFTMGQKFEFLAKMENSFFPCGFWLKSISFINLIGFMPNL